ncbi:E3 ubiquitin-protein ligase RSL1-like [Actinidia eriantha]|uniref:E3 ubiquitin-protein ligase RSL1-like n=1 Tax=Actinidia eriantha TaxID=165200 RepID=UPI00258C6112|nr:E3 ubiquitin-protein ligase RSL1-like [Actinidia eriantha]
MDSEELQSILAEQSRELAAAKATESDLDLAFRLQMQEALTASAQSPSFSTQFQIPDDEVLDPGLAGLFADEIARLERDLSDRAQADAEIRRLQNDLSRRIHDQVFARDLSRISDEEWIKTGDHFTRPYGEGSSSSGAISNAEAFKLYFKGLVREDTARGVKKKTAGMGIAICDFGDDLLFEMRKPLVGGCEMSLQVAEVKALIVGLEVAVSLGIRRIAIFCDDETVFQYVTGASRPKEGNITTLIGQATLLARTFLSCNASLVRQQDIKFALKLAGEAIVSQVSSPEENTNGKHLRETCPICLEDTNVSQMCSVDGCLHRYCYFCMKKHVEVKLLQGMLPKCPYDGCKTELKIESCKVFLTSELFDIMSHRIKESSIPASDKIYCPYSRCSALMSKAEVLVNARSGGSSKCKRCHGLFCVNCKVPWHNNMSCNAYKSSNPYPCAEDAKLKSLATKNLWRQCVKCNHMVELAAGCNHIYCRCGYEFCYICGAEWKSKKPTCTCPLWDERHILYEERNRLQQGQG